MKYLFLLLLVIMIAPTLYGQVKSQNNLSGKQKDAEERHLTLPYKNGHLIAPDELVVGDKMADITLGQVFNTKLYSSKTRISDLKGKLIILDMWTLSCGACMAAFPYMSELQKEFGDKIQIFLVNYGEDEAKIKHYFNRPGGFPVDGGGKAVFPDNLPVIGAAKELAKIFPSKGGPGYHIWIDGNGIIRLRGNGSVNTSAEKIKVMLEGKKIDYVRDEEDTWDPYRPLLYTNTALYKTVAILPEVLQFNSLFTRYSDEFGNSYGSDGRALLKKRDSATGTLRNSYVNNSALSLYNFATGELMKNNNVIWGDRTFLLVNDISLYADDRLGFTGPGTGINGISIYRDMPRWSTAKTTDKILRKSRFCYEQITPVSISDSARQQYMLQDLNRYFGALYSAEGKVEKQKIPCYILMRTSKIDKLKTKGDDGGNSTAKDGDEVKRYKNRKLSEILTPRLGVQFSAFFSINDILLDETGYTDNVDMILPKKIKSLEELRKALQLYDLDIVKEDRELNVLVIREKGYKKN